jgi:branched-chain amino acid:cation transporter, LIVCS family
LIGPFGAIPRCIALSYSTAKMYLPHVSLGLFSFLACLLIFVFTYKRTRIIDILGYVLTPALLISLTIIIVKGVLTSPELPIAPHQELAMFLKGLNDGYQTMDLLGAFFFCSVVLVCLKKDVDVSNPNNSKRLLILTMKASCIGAFLLAAIYVGFSFVAAAFSEQIGTSKPDELIAVMAVHILGPYAGIIVCLAVTLACLTTAIALSSVFAEFIHKDVSLDKINYAWSLVITLVISFFISTLNFNGIANLLAPILQICYPALIVLSLLNIFYKLYHFRPVKIPVLLTFLLSLVVYFV